MHAADKKKSIRPVLKCFPNVENVNLCSEIAEQGLVNLICTTAPYSSRTSEAHGDNPYCSPTSEAPLDPPPTPLQ